MQQDQTVRKNLEEEHQQRGTSYRGLGQIVRGLLFVFVGLFILFSDKLGLGLKASPVVQTIMGYLAIAYGAFRLGSGVWKMTRK